MNCPLDESSGSIPLVRKTAAEYAQSLWDEDEKVCKKNHIVEWIGDGSEFSQNILRSYMAHFNFGHVPLEQAFRDLCFKLHLKGETQQIDRVLCAFSDRYFECNTRCIFGTSDIVHSIIYSLLLLNTDLHVAQGSYKKMSRTEFVNNTMNTIHAQLDQNDQSVVSLYSESSQSFTSSYSFSRIQPAESTMSISHWNIGSRSWDLEIISQLKQMYTNVYTRQITNTLSGAPIRQRMSLKRSIGTMIFKHGNDTLSTQNSVASTTSIASTTATIASQLYCTTLPTSYTSQAPYYKESSVLYKQQSEKVNQKAKNRDWKECFLVIDRSQLQIYKLPSSCLSMKKGLGGGDWKTQSQIITTVDLKHSLTHIGYDKPHVFSVQQSTGAVHLFQAGSDIQAQEWLSTCNYWAARESKHPICGVSSLEYGWSSSPVQVINTWHAPSPSMICSNLDEADQCEALSKHINELNAELDRHHDVKYKMEHFKNSKIENEARINWNNKSQYLLMEIIKYQNYFNCIEKSINLQKKYIDS